MHVFHISAGQCQLRLFTDQQVRVEIKSLDEDPNYLQKLIPGLLPPRDPGKFGVTSVLYIVTNLRVRCTFGAKRSVVFFLKLNRQP